MPLSKNDPTSYIEGGFFYGLAVAVYESFEPYEEHFDPPGQAVAFSQRFYMWRKSLAGRIAILEALEYQSQEDLAEIGRWKLWLQAANRVKIKQPRGQGYIRMVLKVAETAPESPTRDAYLAKHAALLPEDLKYAFSLRSTAQPQNHSGGQEDE